MTVAEIPKTRTPKLVTMRFSEAEQKRRLWVAVCEPGITADDLLEPSYWAHVCARFSPMDRVEVYAEDGTWFAELMVLFASRVDAKLACMRRVEFKAVVPEERPKDFYFKWIGSDVKYRVLRVKDNAKMADGFATTEAAQDWIVQHRKTLAA